MARVAPHLFQGRVATLLKAWPPVVERGDPHVGGSTSFSWTISPLVDPEEQLALVRRGRSVVRALTFARAADGLGTCIHHDPLSSQPFPQSPCPQQHSNLTFSLGPGQIVRIAVHCWSTVTPSGRRRSSPWRR